MQHKKVLVGVLALALMLGGTYAYSSGESLQGRFGVTPSSSTVRNTTSTSSSSTSTTTRPDFYFNGGVSYDSSLNYFKATVCQTNVASADVRQTSLQFSVSGGSRATVQFTPTVTTAASCQTVYSGDLLSTLNIKLSGTYTVTATLDSTSVQTEASESNNTVSTSVTAASSYYFYDPAQLPDLTVSSMEFFAAPYEFEASQMRANVCGLDDLISYPSEGNIEVYYVLSQNGRTLETGETSLTGPTDPFSGSFNSSAGCRTYYIDLDPSVNDTLTSGTVTMNVQLDVLETTPETDENNNGFSQNFTDDVTVAW